MTFLVTFGRAVWPKLECNRQFFRLVLGPVAFWWINEDFEVMLERFQSLLKEE